MIAAAMGSGVGAPPPALMAMLRQASVGSMAEV